MVSNFDPTWPTGAVNLNVDYIQGNKNSTQLDVTYGVDHYKFSDATPNNGYHINVTTPASATYPITTLALPKLFGFTQPQPGANANFVIGTTQYSQGFNSDLVLPSVPTPLTSMMSAVTATAILNTGVKNVIDFTGLSRCVCTLTAWDFTSLASNVGTQAVVIWDNNRMTITQSFTFGGSGGALSIVRSANILQVKNTGVNLTNVYWVCRFDRIN